MTSNGTYVVGAYSFGSQMIATGRSSQFTIEITFETIPPVRPAVPCTVPAAQAATHICLQGTADRSAWL